MNKTLYQLISFLFFSSCGIEKNQESFILKKNGNQQKTFLDWCLDKGAEESLKTTINALKKILSEEDCGNLYYKLISEEINELDLSSQNISDLRPIRQFKYIISFNLANNEIEDMTSLSHLTYLQKLDISNNKISNTSSLTSLLKLKELYAQNNNISELKNIANLTQLEKLDLSSNKISSLEKIKNLLSVSSLNIANNLLTSLLPIKLWQNLSELSLNGNNIAADQCPKDSSSEVLKNYCNSI